MIRNIWRYSHFALAISSSLFVLLATLTGLVLAFEPIQTQLQDFKIPGGEKITLSELVQVMDGQYDEVLEIEVDANYFVRASVISMDEAKDGDFYINPITGEKLADIPNKNTFFEWFTNFHRSLFLKTTGRIFVGITSFLLFLIAITGCLLLIKRQNGIINFFTKVIKEDFAQYYHVILGRLMLIPILIITLTGVYLSLFRFSLLPESKGQKTEFASPVMDTEKHSFSDFEVFKNTQLKDIRKLEFPFSDDVEEVFTLVLKDKELEVNQKTGIVLSEISFPLIKLMTNWSFTLHTGSGSILWSLILLIASLNILFFMYSGGMIAYKRIRSKVKNIYRAQEAEIVILLGTENGSTRDFANTLQQTLIKVGKKTFLDELNHYQHYPHVEHLLVLTSTYGDGDPPANADRFLDLLDRVGANNSFRYAVVGFGSRAYSNFCQFALDIDAKLSLQQYCSQLTPAFLINNKSYESFKQWASDWGTKASLELALPTNLKTKKEKLNSFKVIAKKVVKDTFDETFVLTLQPPARLKFRSGDLLAVYPPSVQEERLYSIGKSTSGEILLSIKKHELGLCSNYLNQLEIHTSFKAALRKNPSFYVPDDAKSLVLIANGTGMAPFLGMVQEKQDIPIYLYWGGRTAKSYELYEPFLAHIDNKELVSIKTVFSKEEQTNRYVQDLLQIYEAQLIAQLELGAVIMICGSIAMQKAVLELLGDMLRTHALPGLDHYIDQQQILMDCY